MTRFSLLSKFLPSKGFHSEHFLVETYQTTSGASIDELWKTITDLADVSWHPLISSTNVPYGLVVKPGLIYKAVPRMLPIPIKIFVEKVRPKEVYCVRILGMPGLEEKVTYQLRSTVRGALVSYSVSLKGWLAPLIWMLTRFSIARVVFNLVQSAEDTYFSPIITQAGLDQIRKTRSSKRSCLDF